MEKREMVARAICKARGGNPEKRIPEFGQTCHSYPQWRDFLKEADAVLADFDTAGYAIVLQGPTGGRMGNATGTHQDLGNLRAHLEAADQDVRDRLKAARGIPSPLGRMLAHVQAGLRALGEIEDEQPGNGPGVVL